MTATQRRLKKALGANYETFLSDLRAHKSIWVFKKWSAKHDITKYDVNLVRSQLGIPRVNITEEERRGKALAKIADLVTKKKAGTFVSMLSIRTDRQIAEHFGFEHRPHYMSSIRNGLGAPSVSEVRKAQTAKRKAVKEEQRLNLKSARDYAAMCRYAQLVVLAQNGFKPAQIAGLTGRSYLSVGIQMSSMRKVLGSSVIPYFKPGNGKDARDTNGKCGYEIFCKNHKEDLLALIEQFSQKSTKDIISEL